MTSIWGKYRISLIGFGNTGTFFFRRLPDSFKNKCLYGIYDRKPSKLKSIKKSGFVKPLSQISKNSDLFFIATEDKNILKSAQSIIRLRGNSRAIFCHFSGSLPSKIFRKIKDFEGKCFSVHPNIPIRTEYYYNSRIIWGIEGNTKLYPEFVKLIKHFKDDYINLKGVDKLSYHFASSFFCNMLLFSYCFASDILRESGIDKKGSLLIPLNQLEVLKAYLTKVEPLNALTGPVFRGDFSTLKSTLSSIKDKKLREIYIRYLKHFLDRHNEKIYLDFKRNIKR